MQMHSGVVVTWIFDQGRYKVGAKINIIGGYSVGAGQKGLLGFAACMLRLPQEIRTVYESL